MWVARDYSGVPPEIAENGVAYGDAPGRGGVVRDERHISFHRGYPSPVG